MDNSPVLSAGQVSFFKENGYLILENCIEPDLLAAWQEQFWWCLNAKFDDPDSWPTDQTFIGRWRFTPPCPNIGAVPMVQAAVDQYQQPPKPPICALFVVAVMHHKLAFAHETDL